MSTIRELNAFATALESAGPDAATACADWTTHELVAHLVAGADEVSCNLTALRDGGVGAVPATRPFDEREAPYRAMADAELRARLEPAVERLVALVESLCAGSDPDPTTVWTGRTMPVRAFVTHVRSELAIHRWDIVGHDAIGSALLGEPALTVHAVGALGDALLAGGSKPARPLRLASPNADEVLVSANGLAIVSPSADPDGAPAASGHAADRLLLLWGRFAPRPDGLSAPAGVETWRALREVLAGY